MKKAEVYNISTGQYKYFTVVYFLYIRLFFPNKPDEDRYWPEV